jgi:hypothetical protein
MFGVLMGVRFPDSAGKRIAPAPAEKEKTDGE